MEEKTMTTEDKVRYVAAKKKLAESVEVNPLRMGGRPVIKNTRFPFSQIIQELADGNPVKDIANDFNQPLELIVKALEGFSILVDINRLEPFGGNWDIVDGLKYAKNLEREMIKKFQGTDFFKALQKHIGSTKCVLIKKIAPVVSWRGTGLGIGLKTIKMRYEGGEVVCFDIEIDVDFYDDNSDPPYGSIYTDVSVDVDIQCYNFLIPKDLVIDFTQEKFDKWIQSKVNSKKNQELDRIAIFLKSLGKKIVDLEVEK